MLSVARELDIIGDFLKNPTFTYRSFSLRWCWEISFDMVLCLDLCLCTFECLPLDTFSYSNIHISIKFLIYEMNLMRK